MISAIIFIEVRIENHAICIGHGRQLFLHRGTARFIPMLEDSFLEVLHMTWAWNEMFCMSDAFPCVEVQLTHVKGLWWLETMRRLSRLQHCLLHPEG